jgi:enoyl-CoA hydratase/carnithine racemase
MQDIGDIILTIRNIPKPVIGAVNGNAIGAGLSLALVCDIIIASDKAKFGAPFVKVGLHPDNGATCLLVQRLGLYRATELLLTSRIIDARQAEKIGLVNQIAPADQLDEIVWKTATDLSKMPPLSVKMTKASLYQALTLDFAAVLELEARAQSILSSTQDFKEAMDAINEKRDPIFKGR